MKRDWREVFAKESYLLIPEEIGLASRVRDEPGESAMLLPGLRVHCSLHTRKEGWGVAETGLIPVKTGVYVIVSWRAKTLICGQDLRSHRSGKNASIAEG